MIARRPSFDTDTEPDLVEPYRSPRDREREKKRRQRARRYDKGLKADGTPVTNLELSIKVRRFWEPKHPDGCRCYDCLFGGER